MSVVVVVVVCGLWFTLHFSFSSPTLWCKFRQQKRGRVRDGKVLIHFLLLSPSPICKLFVTHHTIPHHKCTLSLIMKFKWKVGVKRIMGRGCFQRREESERKVHLCYYLCVCISFTYLFILSELSWQPP